MSLRRLMLTAVVSLCSLAGVVLLLAPVALAVTQPPVVEEMSVLDVAGTSATLQAKIDPEGNETTYRFEYGTSTAYGSSVPIPDGIVGSGSAGVTVSAHPQDLSPSTEYHYRVVAIVASRGEMVPGGDGSFITQPSGSAFALSDGRRWELVSPPDKHGALIGSLSPDVTTKGPIQAAQHGGGLTYLTSVPTELEPAGYVIGEQVLSVRGAQGWSSLDIGTAHGAATHAVFAKPDYQFFSSDLSAGLADPEGEDATLLSTEASAPTPYIRREDLCDTSATASECYLPLLTGKQGIADVPPGTEFGNFGEVQFEGASPDLSHVVLTSKVALTEVPIAQHEIYEWSTGAPVAGAVQLVSVLPASEGGGPVMEQGNVNVGANPEIEWSGGRHSISDDGSRVFWEVGGFQGGSLYMRDTVKDETVRLDVQQPGAPSREEHPRTKFQIASSDGSKVFFTDNDQGQALTAQSGANGSDLYECEIVEEAGKLTCRLTDLTPESNGQSAEVQNIVSGASEDGSYVYFVANGVLAGSGATAQGSCGEFAPSSARCNLYVYHEGVVTFIAALSDDDEAAWGSEDEVFHTVGKLTARVSPDGRYMAFMSDMPLTGYDTRDAGSGKPDQEVYLYDAQAGHLTCVSCDPTGSRPVGVEVAKFARGAIPGEGRRSNLVGVLGGQGETFGSENWVAANLPPGNALGEHQESLYQPRALFDDGRLFFNSDDALVSQDVNGQEDVYEYEPDWIGSCTSSNATFSEKAGGCVGLVSAGTSPEESGFMDASEGGGDAFFLTTSRLTSQDFDTSLDVYDAHECSTSSPCLSSSAPVPSCSTGDSCKASPSPQPSIFGAPASSTFTGSGNVVASSAPVVKVRSLTRAQKRAQALKACKKKPKRKRSVCERQAKKRDAVKAARRAVKSKSKGKG